MNKFGNLTILILFFSAITGLFGEAVNDNGIRSLLRTEREQSHYNLESHLNTKVYIWLSKMDWYVRERDPKHNEELYDFCKDIFADRFYYGMVGAQGHGAEMMNDLWKSREYELREWVWSQGIEEMQRVVKHGAFVAAPRPHYMEVIEPGKIVKLRGFHDHIFWGDFAFFLGSSTHVAWEEITFENFKGRWLITHYNEIVYDSTPILIHRGNLFIVILLVSLVFIAVLLSFLNFWKFKKLQRSHP
ncbi:MAG: hypothetical protein SH817_03840 [Leptospira sp.]|nr:hypothetical protein [Leptospira sp.]